MSEQTLLRLRERLHVERERISGGVVQYDARCPAHHDRHASVVFGPGTDRETGQANGKIVLHCHAGCTTQAILDEIDMTLADLQGEPHVVATYPYYDEDGAHLWDVQRWEPKDFRVHPKLPPVAERRLYHSEWLRAARTDARTVWIVEGEKDADSLAKVGEIAVCGVGGAGKWLPVYTAQLVELDVVIVADDDEAGQRHAREVARALDGRAASVALALPAYGKDITDHLDAGYGLDKLVPLSINPNLEIHRADQVLERPISWLWPGFLPRGKLVIIEGDPGDGKSVLTLDLAAKLSRGAELPDGSRCPLGPVSSCLISAEDDPEDTIRPRLRVAGADLKRVTLITGGSTPGEPFDLGGDLEPLEAHVTENKIALVCIDPVMAFLPSTVDSYRDSDVRRVLHPLSRMAMRTDCVVLIVRHLVKGRSKAITAGGGSIGFIGAARVGFLVGPNPEDEAQRVLTCVKINIGQRPEPLAYRVVSSPETPDAPVIEWSSERPDLSAQDLLDGLSAIDDRDAQSDARGFLAELLEENPTRGWKWADVVKRAKREGHSETALRRVRPQLAAARVNPILPDGTMQRGTWWFARTVDPRRDAEPAPADEAPAEPADEAPEVAPDASSSGPCDECGRPGVRYGADLRCLAHSPLMDDDDDEDRWW